MKKILCSLLIFLVVFLSFASVHLFFQSESTVRAFRHFASPQFKISLDLLKQFESGTPEEKGKAEKEIITAVLKALEYDRWHDFIEYIELKHYVEIIKPNTPPQLITVLNLSKDLSVIAIYTLVGNNYVFDDKIDGLVFVEKLQFIPIEEKGFKGIVIYQIMDEKLGGFFYEKYIDIYYYLTDSLEKVWYKTLYYEEIYKENWVHPEGDQHLWNRVVEETTLDFISQQPFKINSISTLSKYQATSKKLPGLNQFSQTQSDTFQQAYQWSAAYKTFILGEVSHEVFLKRAALLEDMEMGVEVLYGFKNDNYKMMSLQGEIFYLPKNKFSGLLQN